MAFDFNRMFSRPKAEQQEQGVDVIEKLASHHQDALHVIKVKREDGQAFSEADNASFGVIRLELASMVGQEVAEAALAEYMHADLPSRVENLKGLLERQPALRTKLFASLENAMHPNNTDAISALQEVKAFIKVADARHFSDQDINQLCDEIIASAEFEAYKKAKEDALIASVVGGSGQVAKTEIYKSPYAGDTPRHIARDDEELIEASDVVNIKDDPNITWKPPNQGK